MFPSGLGICVWGAGWGIAGVQFDFLTVAFGFCLGSPSAFIFPHGTRYTLFYRDKWYTNFNKSTPRCSRNYTVGLFQLEPVKINSLLMTGVILLEKSVMTLWWGIKLGEIYLIGKKQVHTLYIWWICSMVCFSFYI